MVLKVIFASNKFGTGGYDIYSFDMPVDAGRRKWFLFKGQLKNDDNEVPDSARIEIRNISSKQVEQIDYMPTVVNMPVFAS